LINYQSHHLQPLNNDLPQLFSGNPTLKHFHLWNRDATFTDPLTIARGFDKYAAQWYGLPTVFNPIQILSHKVTSAKNPIEMELRNKYTIKGFGYDQTIDSTVLIHMGSDGKIDKVEDKWNGELPSGPVSEVRDLDGNAPPPPAYNQIPVDDNDSMIAEVGSMATEAGRAITTVGSKKKRENNNNTSGPIWGVGNLVDLVIVLMFWPLAVFFLALSKAFRIGWFVFCHVAWWPVFVVRTRSAASSQSYSIGGIAIGSSLLDGKWLARLADYLLGFFCPFEALDKDKNDTALLF